MSGFAGTGVTAGTSQGVVAGAALRAARQELRLSQLELAALLQVDLNTIRAWEIGRRPLANIKTATLRGVLWRLRHAGASDAALRRLDVAVDVDVVLGLLLEDGHGAEPLAHPLASWVSTREWTALLSLAFEGREALLAPVDRARVFEGLRAASEATRGSEDPAAVLLRRQTAYMLGAWDPGSAGWLADMERLELQVARRRPGDWTPSWVACRSFAVAHANAGDPEHLRKFIDGMADDDRLVAADLAYWAYWIGAGPAAGHATTDEFMIEGGLQAWDQAALLRHLTKQLAGTPPHLELTVHSLWALLGRRPRLLEESPDDARLLERVAAMLLDGEHDVDLGRRARREIDQLNYAARILRGSR